MIDPVFLLAIPVFMFTMMLEAALLWREQRVSEAFFEPGPRGYDPADSFGSLSMGIGFVVLDMGWKLVSVALWTWLYQHRVFDLSWSVGTWLLLVFADDFCMYVSHRLSHEVRFMWCGHHNHHSSEHFNLSTALRQSWTEQLWHPVIWAVLPLLGFPVEMMLLQFAFNLLYQYWTHTELVGKLGRFGWIFNTPSHHRVHHGRNPQYMDRNYGGIFIIWDRLFGTFEPEVEPVDYGVTNPVGSDNPLKIAFFEWRAMFADVAAARTLRGKLGHIFGPPGWREDGHHQTAKVARAAWEAAQSEATAAK